MAQSDACGGCGLQDRLRPYGSDAAFDFKSAIFNPVISDREGWFYNMTNTSEVNVRGVPHGFFPRKLEGRQDGFPVVIPTAVDAERAGELFTAIDDGQYIDGKTQLLVVQVVAYNSRLELMSFAEAVFTADPARGAFVFKAMQPQVVWSYAVIDHRTYILAALFALLMWMQAALSRVWLVLLWPWFFILDALQKVVCSPCRAMRFLAVGGGKGNGEQISLPKGVNAFPWFLQARLPLASFGFRQYLRNELKIRIAGAGFIMDGLVLVFMMFAYICFNCALIMETKLTGASSFEIYQAPQTSLARFFQPAKIMENGTIDGAVANLTGRPHSWELPDNEDGLTEMARMISSLSTVSELTVFSTAFHVLPLVLAIIRLLSLWSFQAHFGIIALTILKSVPDLLAVMVITSIVIMLLSASAHILMGDIYSELKTPGASLYIMYLFLLTGNLGNFHRAVTSYASSNGGLHRGLLSHVSGHMLYVLTAFLISFTLLNFILAVIADAYYTVQDNIGPRTGIPEQVGHILRKRRGWRAALSALRAVRSESERSGGTPATLVVSNRRSSSSSSGEDDAVDSDLEAVAHWLATRHIKGRGVTGTLPKQISLFRNRPMIEETKQIIMVCARRLLNEDDMGLLRSQQQPPAIDMVNLHLQNARAQLLEMQQMVEAVEDMAEFVNECLRNPRCLTVIMGRKAARSRQPAAILSEDTRPAESQKPRHARLSGSPAKVIPDTDGLEGKRLDFLPPVRLKPFMAAPGADELLAKEHSAALGGSTLLSRATSFFGAPWFGPSRTASRQSSSRRRSSQQGIMSTISMMMGAIPSPDASKDAPAMDAVTVFRATEERPGRPPRSDKLQTRSASARTSAGLEAGGNGKDGGGGRSGRRRSSTAKSVFKTEFDAHGGHNPSGRYSAPWSESAPVAPVAFDMPGAVPASGVQPARSRGPAASRPASK